MVLQQNIVVSTRLPVRDSLDIAAIEADALAPNESVRGRTPMDNDPIVSPDDPQPSTSRGFRGFTAPDAAEIMLSSDDDY